MNLHFQSWLEHTAPTKIGIVRTRPIPDQIDRLDQAIRKLAATDPWYSRSRILQAYAKGLPLP
jgi:hypothetical protein